MAFKKTAPKKKLAPKKTPTKSAEKPAPKASKASLFYCRGNLTGSQPAIKGGVVFNPKDHTDAHGVPLTDRMKEFADRGLVHPAPKGAKVGERVKG